MTPCGLPSATRDHNLALARREGTRDSKLVITFTCFSLDTPRHSSARPPLGLALPSGRAAHQPLSLRLPCRLACRAGVGPRGIPCTSVKALPIAGSSRVRGGRMCACRVYCDREW